MDNRHEGVSRAGSRRLRVNDRGAVLITVLLVMVGLLGLGITALWLTTGTMQVGGNTNLRNQALYVAEAAIERARIDLNTRNPFDAPKRTEVLTGYGNSQDNVPTGVDANGNPVNAAGQPAYGAIYRSGQAVPVDFKGQTFPPATFDRSYTSPTMGTYTVWIRNDNTELRQGSPLVDTNQTMVLRSRGVAPDGKTQVILEVTMAPGTTPGPAPNPPNPNAPVLCNAGKNACDDNSSVQSGVVVQ